MNIIPSAMNKLLPLMLLTLLLTGCSDHDIVQGDPLPQLSFSSFAGTWDEAIPLGNGMLGALVWKRGENLRISLDRADLWDLRPMPWVDDSTWRFSWVTEQWHNNNYGVVQQAFDRPYDELPAPSKIPAGALEFNISALGEPEYVRLLTREAVCEVKWQNGTTLTLFVSAEDNTGWFRFDNTPGEIVPLLLAPSYHSPAGPDATGLHAGDLQQLGYPAGSFVSDPGRIVYTQRGWGDFNYQIAVEWKNSRSSTTGCWSITSSMAQYNTGEAATDITKRVMSAGFDKSFPKHVAWWRNFWAASSVSLPDSVLHNQWYLEMYKFGSAARSNTPPVSLQAVWTADNGRLPPWKGDFHHDLNTQLSYWPAYSSNHTDEASGFTGWMWELRDTFKWYTRTYYETDGLNVPGVTTLTGQPMGGWIQYSFGPTVSAWLAHHFYLQWRYTMDREFLEGRAYPWIRDVAIHLRDLAVMDENGKKRLPLSSSPEIFDNSARAWFPQMSNFDLALVRWSFEKAAELAAELGFARETDAWIEELALWPEYATDDSTGLLFAPGLPYEGSHRHFSHLMAIHPLSIIDYSGSSDDRRVIDLTIANLEANGSDWWTGYSFAWLGNLYARTFRGDDAAEALRTFAECFCLPNSFHANGDQSKSGKSKFQYRPFTLEGNFAFAAGIQEMLLQSHTGVVRIFPAIPSSWSNVSFTTLRTEGAFLVSATKQNGRVTTVTIASERGGTIVLENPFGEEGYQIDARVSESDGNLTITLRMGEKIILSVSS
jgi:alpha-L-fucosidase 2